MSNTKLPSLKMRFEKKTEYETIAVGIVMIEKRVPVWINPNAYCPLCHWRFLENPEDKYATVVKLENGEVVWCHESCFNNRSED